MRPTTRRTMLKTLAGAGAVGAVSGFPFVNRLALGQQALKLGVVVPMTGPMALEAQEMLTATQIAVEDVNAAGAGSGRRRRARVIRLSRQRHISRFRAEEPR